IHAGAVLPDLRRRDHADGAGVRNRPPLGRAFPGPSRRQGSGVYQHRCHRCEDRAYRHLYHHRRRGLSGEHLCGELLGWRTPRRARPPHPHTAAENPPLYRIYPDGKGAKLDATRETESLFDQVRTTMLVTVFVFVGIEGASVYSRYARKRSDVGLATVLGFLGVLCLLILVTMLSYGILLRPDLAALRTPSLAGVLEAIVGRWGAVFISVGLLISVLGNYLSWSLLAAEVVFSAAKNDTMPAFLARENANKVPVGALWATNIMIQIILLI